MNEHVRPEQLLGDLRAIHFIEIVLVIADMLAVIGLIRRSLPDLAQRSPSKLRHHLLSMISVLRLMLVVGSINLGRADDLRGHAAQLHRHLRRRRRRGHLRASLPTGRLGKNRRR